MLFDETDVLIQYPYRPDTTSHVFRVLALTMIAPSTVPLTTYSLIEILAEHLPTRFPLPPIALRTNAFTPTSWLYSSFVDYVSFCGAVEPKHGGRDLDNQRRVLHKAWKQKHKEPTSKTNSSSGRQPPPQLQVRYPPFGRRWDQRGDAQSVRESSKPPPPLQPVVLKIPPLSSFLPVNMERGL